MSSTHNIPGIVFTSLLSFTEEEYGLEMVDKVLEGSPRTDGVYIAYRDYPAKEFGALQGRLLSLSQIDPDTLARHLGKEIMRFIMRTYDFLFEKFECALSAIRDFSNILLEITDPLFAGLTPSTLEFEEQEKHNMTIRYTSTQSSIEGVRGFLEALIFSYPGEYDLAFVEQQDENITTWTLRKTG